MSKRGWAMAGLIAAIGLVGCASDDWMEKYEEQQRLNLDLASQNNDLRQGKAEAAARGEQLLGQNKLLGDQAQRDRDLAEAEKRRAEELSGKIGAAPAGTSTAGTFDSKAIHDIADQIKRDLGNKGTVAVTKDGNIDITLESDVTFAPGSAEISEAGKKSIRSLSSLLKGQFAPYQVRVEGHTDSTPLKRTAPQFKDNFGLGSARSLAVVRFMESDMAIEPSRLMSASRGQHEPVADDKSESGRRKNRRVEIVVVVPHDAAMSMAK